LANYTAADVKRLRELTGSGMLDCKNALVEADGDFERAVEVLRIKGAKDVGKRAERATAEGLVAAKGGALIELNSETDFVAKNEEFQSVAAQIVNAAAESKAADVDALKAAKIGDKTVEQVIKDGDRDNWFTAQEALEYGFVDHVREFASDVAGGGGTEEADAVPSESN
jgi:elongation factor Ts